MADDDRSIAPLPWATIASVVLMLGALALFLVALAALTDWRWSMIAAALVLGYAGTIAASKAPNARPPRPRRERRALIDVHVDARGHG